MIRSFLWMLLLIAAVAVTASAGTIEGTVSPGKSSVVYVDTIQGKRFRRRRSSRSWTKRA